MDHRDKAALSAEGQTDLPHFCEDQIMKKSLSGIWAAVFAATVSAASPTLVDAAPFMLPKVEVARQSDVIQVRDGVRWRGNVYRGGVRYGRNWHGNGIRRGGNYAWHNGYGGYGGYGGYYGHYPQYRYNDGLWISGGALIVGALIGSAIVNNSYYGGYYGGGAYHRRSYATSGSGHIDWCRNHYRSYRIRDNSFQPYNGPRRPCYSPFR